MVVTGATRQEDGVGKWSLPLPPQKIGVSLPKTNIAPENGWLEDEFPFRMAYFSGAMLVLGRVCLEIC